MNFAPPKGGANPGTIPSVEYVGAQVIQGWDTWNCVRSNNIPDISFDICSSLKLDLQCVNP